MRTTQRRGPLTECAGAVCVLALVLPWGALAGDDAIDLPEGFAHQVVVQGLTGATGMAVAPDGRVFVCEQTGALRVVKDDALLAEPFVALDVDSTWERGLIGVTLDPEFPRRAYVYVCYVAAKPYPHHRVSRFTAQGDRAEPGSELVLLEGDDQRKLGGVVPAGHQGGGLHFGSDGKIYVAIGEQTAGAPAQRLDTLQGKLLRLNADGSIPEDNPFFTAARDKYRAIWAIGLRNPFGFAVQPGTGRIFINDVGDARWEEINEGARGANYGWPESEGLTANPKYRSPIHTYREAGMNGISGGVFYDAPRPQFPASYVGKYFFADFNREWVRVLDPEHPLDVQPFAASLKGPVALDLARDGSLYVLLRDAWVKDGQFRPKTGALLRVVWLENSERPGLKLTKQPAHAFVAVGERATFRVEALGSPLHFRWQRNGRWIPGAESAEYSIPVSAADDGARFHCVVSSPAGTMRTRVAVLRVERLREPVNAGPAKPGLQYLRKDGIWTRLPAFERSPQTAGPLPVVDDLSVVEKLGSDRAAFSFRGLIDIDRAGIYAFRLRSSGAAAVFVAGDEIATVGLTNGPRKATGWIGLKAGTHAIRLDVAFGKERPELAVTYASSPDLAERPIPADRLSFAGGFDRAPRRPLLTTRNVPRSPAEDLPRLLSETGLFRSLAPLEPEAGVWPYEVNAPLWSDGALKRRWIALPGDRRIGFRDTGAWAFPVKTVFVKHFELGTEAQPRRLETRLLVIAEPGQGYGVTYRWREDQTDAELLDDGLTEEIAFAGPGGSRTQKWTYPSRGECLVCHTIPSGFVRGVNTRQLNRAPAETPAGENQLRVWSRSGLFERTLDDATLDRLPRLSNLHDASASLEQRARSYFDANCAQCHRPGGVRAAFDARFETPLERQGLIHGAVTTESLGISGASLITPGDPSRSMVYQRMMRRADVFNMPPLATHQVDREAVELFARWIGGLEGAHGAGTKDARGK